MFPDRTTTALPTRGTFITPFVGLSRPKLAPAQRFVTRGACTALEYQRIGTERDTGSQPVVTAQDRMSDGEFRQLLQSRGLKAGDVARRLGVHKNTVSNWATGKTPVVPAHLRDLAQLLGTSIDQLAGIAIEQRSEQADEQSALQLLGKLLESAGAVRTIYHAAPNLMDVLRDAEELLRREGHDPSPQRPRRDAQNG